ncbi:MAG: type II toxin-antitoxin system RatA family toxin [Candidatus Brocadiia bacterium]
MPQVRVSEVVRAEPEAVYRLFLDVESFPRFMPNVERIEVVERGEGWAVSRWLTDLDGAPLTWCERDTYDPENLVVAFQLTEGDIAKFEGHWAFLPHEAGTLALCVLDYELGVPLIEEVVGPTLREKVERNIATMLAAVEARVSAVAPGRDI